MKAINCTGCGIGRVKVDDTLPWEPCQVCLTPVRAFNVPVVPVNRNSASKPISDKMMKFKATI